MTTALVLGAGGLTGQAFHLGVLSALHELTGFDGRRADVVVGTSAGSLVAAGLTGGLSAADQVASLTGEPMSEEGHELLRAHHARTAAPAMPQPPPSARRRPLAPGAVLAAAPRPWGGRARPAWITRSTIWAAASMASRRTSIGVGPAWASTPVTRTSSQRWPCAPVTTPTGSPAFSSFGPCSMWHSK